MPRVLTPVFSLDEDYSLAVVEDLEEMLPLMIAMHKESVYNQFPLRKGIEKTLQGMSIGLYFKDELVGFLNCLVIDHPLVEVKMAMEQGWYVRPDHRGKHSTRLIEAYEVWATMNDAKVLQLSHMNTDVLDKVYEKFGFKLYEKAFIKCL